MHELSSLPSLQHLLRMTDDNGIVQHARFDKPNYDEGYSIDDNARALILVIEWQRYECRTTERLDVLGSRYMTYLQDAFNGKTRRFRNFVDRNLRWLEETGSEDCHGRALHALGHTVAYSTDAALRTRAARLFEFGLSATVEFTSPRAWAFVLLGIDAYSQAREDRCCARQTQELLAQRLLRLYEVAATDDWPWFESILTYCNAKLPHALLRSGFALDRDDMIEAALEALVWLADVHTAEDGHFIPIGSNGFYRKNEERAIFDQQPIEAHAAVEASLDAYGVTSDDFWIDEAVRAYRWFLGGNHLGIRVGDPETGACYDGLHPKCANLNQGAESTLAYLLSSMAMHRSQGYGASRNCSAFSP